MPCLRPYVNWPCGTRRSGYKNNFRPGRQDSICFQTTSCRYPDNRRPRCGHLSEDRSATAARGWCRTLTFSRRKLDTQPCQMHFSSRLKGSACRGLSSRPTGNGAEQPIVQPTAGWHVRRSTRSRNRIGHGFAPHLVLFPPLNSCCPASRRGATCTVNVAVESQAGSVV